MKDDQVFQGPTTQSIPFPGSSTHPNTSTFGTLQKKLIFCTIIIIQMFSNIYWALIHVSDTLLRTLNALPHLTDLIVLIIRYK
jgi:hypothetical protein